MFSSSVLLARMFLGMMLAMLIWVNLFVAPIQLFEEYSLAVGWGMSSSGYHGRLAGLGESGLSLEQGVGRYYSAGCVDTVMLDLSLARGGLKAIDVVVTIVNGSREVELPFIPLPEGVVTVRYLTGYKLALTPLYTLFPGMYLSPYGGYNNYAGQQPSGYKPALLKYVGNSVNTSKILVFLPGKLSEPVPSYSGWYHRALEQGLAYRALYSYEGYMIYVYYGDTGREVSHLVDLPYQTPAVLGVKLYRSTSEGRILYEQGYTMDLLGILGSIHRIPSARFIGVEAAGQGGYYGYSGGGFMWYIRPWSTDNPREGTLGVLRNQVISGVISWSRSDYFYYMYNTTRYELWTWLSSDKNVWVRFRLYINNNKVWDQRIYLKQGVLYGLGTIVHTCPEKPGNYLEPAPGRVNVRIELLHISNPSAKIWLNTIAVARAYIKPLTQDNGVYRVYNYLKGIGDINSDNDERYVFLLHGEAVLTFIAGNNVFESAGILPYVYLIIDSSPAQPVDRRISVYLNGKLICEGTSRRSRGSNTRTFTCLAYGKPVADEIISSMKKGVSPTIKIVIHGFEQSIDKWYLTYGVVSYGSRMSCIPYEYEDLVREDPTRAASNYYSACSWSAIPLVREYKGVQLWSGNTDLKQHQITLMTSVIKSGDRGDLWIGVDANPTGRHVYDQQSFASYFIDHVEINMHISSLETSLSGPVFTFWAPPPSSEREETVNTIQWGIWVLSLVGSILSFAGGHWTIAFLSLASTALSCPSLFYYGYVAESSCYQEGSHDIICRATYDTGWDYERRNAPVTFKVVVRIMGSGDDLYVDLSTRIHEIYVYRCQSLHYVNSATDTVSRYVKIPVYR